jgi:hypothetical protein
MAAEKQQPDPALLTRTPHSETGGKTVRRSFRPYRLTNHSFPGLSAPVFGA